MDIIQGLIEAGNTGGADWRIVNNNGVFDVLNNSTNKILYSILNDGSIGDSSNINSNININVITNYVSGSGVSPQWTTLGAKIYYNYGNVGIGTIDPITPLNIYNTSNARLLLDTTTTGTASVDFRRGTGVDMQNDYRFINDTNGYIKLQCENNTQSFTDTTANLAWFSSNETIIHKNTAMNGRIGVGTTYHTSRSLDVVGDANILGLMTTSNLSVSGSATITNSLSNTSLTIQNGLIPVVPNEIVVSGTTSNIIGVDRIIQFPYTTDSAGLTGQTQYTFTTSQNIICDILIVGGGGGGGRAGGGGGGGGILFSSSLALNSNSSITVKVGKGGTGTAVNLFTNGTNGFDSSITISSIEYIAKGGGGGGTRNASSGAQNGSNGGSGGGGSTANFSPQAIGGVSNKNTYANFQSFGNNGGAGKPDAGGQQPLLSAGGGGGAGGVGVNWSATTGGGNGGLGKEFIAFFGTSVGHSGYFGGGGGGNTYNAPGLAYTGNEGYGNGGNGLFGGGGNGGLDGTTATTTFEYPGADGLSNTGGGGGGGKFSDGQGTAEDNNGGHGGTGVVIIRYRNATTVSSASFINFVRGTTADANHDYKVGNYNGEFKVISSVSNVDTDYIKITTAGAISNPTGTASWNTGSDRRIKENIERASYDKCYENINRLELNRFNYIDGFNKVNKDKKQLGFIAQEVYEVFPKSVSSQGYYSDTLNIPDLLSIDITQINYSLYGAVKKLIEINNEKDRRLKSLKYQVETLKSILLNPTVEASTSNLIADA